MSDQLDCVVAGAGVVGLAVARSLAFAGREVVILEAEPEIGMHTSSRNSEVIHAGLYYGADSLKARLCVQGRVLLYQYCEDRKIPYKRIGKLIVASFEDESTKLEAIHAQAMKNGVGDLSFVDEARVREMEPAIRCHKGLFSPSTGIIDSHSLMMSMQADIEAQGGSVLTHSRVSSVKTAADGFKLTVEGVGEEFGCKTFINAAGLWATDKDRFIESIGQYFPDLDESRLTPAYTGIRPKLSDPGADARDFVIQGPAEHGVAGLVNLFGIESPGLTASLAIGNYVKGLLQ
jgi:L-2-hydroxyglutarate oxidase LhgO